MPRTLLFLFTLHFTLFGSYAQSENAANDAEASALLQKVSGKYKSQKNVSADFLLIIQRPKLKPEESDRKYTDTLKGKILMQGPKFNVSLNGQQIICDGKNIWTYLAGDKEVQVNYFEESDEVFSPSKIFTVYNEGWLHQVKEKKTISGKKMTVVEMAPSGKKLSYFKIDVTIDDAALQITESKVYEKNGVRYIYKLTKQASNINTSEDTFTFDTKKYPGINVVDLR